MFKGGKESYRYYSQIETAKSKLPGFFAYDLLAVNLLIQAFIKARDDDFRVAISNDGKYGNSYQQLIEGLEQMLVDKRINIDLDFAGVSFSKIDSDGNIIELYPEDLSHGELKRLSLYMWLKFNKIENAIVLMDEVEIALHPDWQYQIVNDLQTWAPNNQYILATHSHELDANFYNACIPSYWTQKRPQFFNCGDRLDTLNTYFKLLDLNDREPEISFLTSDLLFALVDVVQNGSECLHYHLPCFFRYLYDRVLS